MTVADKARGLLRQALGADADFRDGQLEAILALVENHQRVLVVERTGWGKSIVYFLATRLLRDAGTGPTILISPLLALMRDQVRMANALGLRAETIDSSNTSRWNEIDGELKHDAIDLLLVSPERLGNDRFRQRTIAAIPLGIGLFVVDEAHCISDWGHDFRPDYRRIKGLTQAVPAGVPLVATTATANDRVIADVAEQLGPDLRVVRGPLARESLYLQVVHLHDQAERLAWLVEYLGQADGSGIVYVLTVADAIRVSSWLKENGVEAPAYYGGLAHDEKVRLEDRLRMNDVRALVATVALGMGFDKPDLGFVVHFQRPGSVISFYQQIGRAGRQLERAEVVLLSGAEDDEIAHHFIDSAFPPDESMRGVLAAVDSEDGATMASIEAELNEKHGMIEKALKLLEVDGAVAHDRPRWFRTVNAWEPDTARIEAVTQTRHDELERMQEFTATDECLMRYITGELDDPASEPCGRCANCAGPFVDDGADPATVHDANVFLKRAYRPIEPRKRWQGGAGAIAEELRLEEGLALCSWGSAGWGDAVRAWKFENDGFGDHLVEAVAEMVEFELRPDVPPTWVTSVPSRRHDIVPDFARRLAYRLDLPYRSALTKMHDTPPQKQMQNGTQQAANAIGSFAGDATEVESGPVLLVDDMVDSRWSLTACGVALREHGSGPVFPVALADTSGGGGS